MKILNEFGCDHVRLWKIFGVFKAFIFEPENVKIDFIPLNEFFVSEAVKAFGFSSGIYIFRVVTFDEVFEVFIAEWICFEGEVHIGSKIIDPELIGPGFTSAGPVVKKEHVCFYALSIENPCWEAQQGVDVAVLKQLFSHDFYNSTEYYIHRF